MEEKWLCLALTLDDANNADQFDFAAYNLEQDIYALLYSYGVYTIHEQDHSTLDGKTLPEGKKKLFCYFETDKTPLIIELRTAIMQIARQSGREIETDISDFTDNSWKDNWKAWFKPAQVSPRIAIRAPWCEFEAPEGTQILVIEPGMAFGTGLHETTRLCISFIDKYATQDTHSLIDVGCGSGVLSIAAAKCGIQRVVGLDNDPIAVEVSIDNARLNKTDCQFSETPVGEIKDQFDIVVSNIISSVLILLRNDLKKACRPGGIIILSGILNQERESVEKAFLEGDPGIKKLEHTSIGEWSSIVFKKC